MKENKEFPQTEVWNYESLKYFNEDDIPLLKKFMKEHEFIWLDVMYAKLEDFLQDVLDYLENNNIWKIDFVKNLDFLNDKDFFNRNFYLDVKTTLFSIDNENLLTGFKIYNLLLEIAKKNNMDLPDYDKSFIAKSPLIPIWFSKLEQSKKEYDLLKQEKTKEEVKDILEK